MRIEDVKLGTMISFPRHYPRAVKGRFPGSWRNIEKEPISQPGGVGYIVGIRNVIMANCKHTCGGGKYEDWEPGYTIGDKERMLLVTAGLLTEPFLVRIEEAEPMAA